MGEEKKSGKRKNYFRVTVRLYRQHDMDLISLYRTEGFGFRQKMREAASAAARGQKVTFDVPENAFPCGGYVAGRYLLTVYFDPVRDAAAVRMLGEVKPGLRCGFMKALMRRSLSGVQLSAYLKGDGISISMASAAEPGDTEGNRLVRSALSCSLPENGGRVSAAVPSGEKYAKSPETGWSARKTAEKPVPQEKPVVREDPPVPARAVRMPEPEAPVTPDAAGKAAGRPETVPEVSPENAVRPEPVLRQPPVMQDLPDSAGEDMEDGGSLFDVMMDMAALNNA